MHLATRVLSPDDERSTATFLAIKCIAKSRAESHGWYNAFQLAWNDGAHCVSAGHKACCNVRGLLVGRVAAQQQDVADCYRCPDVSWSVWVCALCLSVCLLVAKRMNRSRIRDAAWTGRLACAHRSIITPPRQGNGVLWWARLSVRDMWDISSELNVRSSPNVLCMLPMAVARSSSGNIVIRYVLPVL